MLVHNVVQFRVMSGMVLRLIVAKARLHLGVEDAAVSRGHARLLQTRRMVSNRAYHTAT